MTTEVAAGRVERRKLRFGTIAEAVAEAERVVAADREGRVVRAGNWSVGKSLGHLATWARFSFEGYPEEIRAPWLVRFVLKRMKGKIIHGGMMPGMKMRGVPGGTVGVDEMSAEEGLARFKEAFGRLEREAPGIENPVFGRLTHEEWVQLNLRHAELHLGFLVPR